MNPVYAFTVVMLIWVISDTVSKKTKSLLSSLFVASIIFLVGFMSHPWLVSVTQGTIFETFGATFSTSLLPTSSLLPLGQTIVGFIIVHLGTLISIQELKRQWKTFAIGAGAVVGTTIVMLLVGPLLKDMNYVVGGIAALTGGTVSIIIVQERALALGLISAAALPVLVSAFQGLVGFPITSILLKKEAKRLQGEYRKGTLKSNGDEAANETKRFKNLPFMQSTSGTLFWVGLVVLVSQTLSRMVTNGFIHAFVIALLFGVLLRELGFFKPAVLSGIDAYGLMMLSILIIVFGPLASVTIADLQALLGPLLITFVVGLAGKMLFAILIGKVVGYSLPMAASIGLTALYGFPGTVILSQEAAASTGENEEEVKAIEGDIMPKMIIAGFSTVTITSVIITGIIASLIR